MAPNLALIIEVSGFKGAIKSTAKSSSELAWKEERKRNIKDMCVWGSTAEWCVSNAVGTRTVIHLLIFMMWQNLMLTDESKTYLIFYSEIFVTDTKIKFIKKAWEVSIE